MDMNFDVKAKIEELVEKIQKDPALLKRFQSDPIKTVEGLLGIDLPNDQLEKLVDGVDTNFAMRDYTCLGLVALEDGSIYALFETGREERLYRYEYDPDAVSQVTQVLKLYTVYENSVLTQAAVMYHKAHPEVLISIESEYPMGGCAGHPDDGSSEDRLLCAKRTAGRSGGCGGPHGRERGIAV